MYIVAVELWIKKWAPPIVWTAGISLIILSIAGVTIFGIAWSNEQNKAPTSCADAWKTTLSIAAPILIDDESGEEYVDWNQCIMVTESGAACMHPDRPYHLPDKHDWIPDTRYQCVDLTPSGYAHGDDKTLLDHLLFAAIPLEGCRWSCDPAKDDFCHE